MDLFSGLFDAVGGLFSAIGSINWEVIVQLTLVSLIMISGPVVIFVLAVRQGDL
jgi:hypothetical protein